MEGLCLPLASCYSRIQYIAYSSLSSCTTCRISIYTAYRRIESLGYEPHPCTFLDTRAHCYPQLGSGPVCVWGVYCHLDCTWVQDRVMPSSLLSRGWLRWCRPKSSTRDIEIKHNHYQQPTRPIEYYTFSESRSRGWAIHLSAYIFRGENARPSPGPKVHVAY